MQDPLEEIEERFMEEVHSLTIDKRALSVILLQYDRLESETTERLLEHDAGHMLLGLQRTLAAARLSTAIVKDADTETAVELFERSNELGYDTPEDRLVTTAIFARICLKNGRADLAVSEFEDALQSANVPDRDREEFKTLLNELRANVS